MQSIPLAIFIGLLLGFACFGVIKTAENVAMRLRGYQPITCQMATQ